MPMGMARAEICVVIQPTSETKVLRWLSARAEGLAMQGVSPDDLRLRADC